MNEKGFMEMPLSKLVKAAWNYKHNDDALLEKLKSNIKRNGQIENIIVRELPTGFFEVVNGNHRFDALTQLDMEAAFVFNLGKISDAAAQRIAIETNETKFASDSLRLAELMNEIVAEFPMEELTSTMPYTEEEIKRFNDLLDFDWSKLNSGGGESSGESPAERTKEITIKVPEETYNLWRKWLSRAKDMLGYDSPERAFEFAIVEAMNIPEESLKR